MRAGSCRGGGMEDVRDLKELQIDALREVANIGAGHAATALSQLTNRKIMISVPQINIVRLRSEEHTSELQSRLHLVCRLLLEKKKNICYLFLLSSHFTHTTSI